MVALTYEKIGGICTCLCLSTMKQLNRSHFQKILAYWSPSKIYFKEIIWNFGMKTSFQIRYSDHSGCSTCSLIFQSCLAGTGIVKLIILLNFRLNLNWKIPKTHHAWMVWWNVWLVKLCVYSSRYWTVLNKATNNY